MQYKYEARNSGNTDTFIRVFVVDKSSWRLAVSDNQQPVCGWLLTIKP